MTDWQDCWSACAVGVASSDRCQWLYLGESWTWATDIFPQVFPDIVGHFEEHLDELGVELAAGPEFDFLAGSRKCLRRAVGAVGGHGVEGVGDREHACGQGGLLARQAAGIGLSPVTLRVGVNGFGAFRQKPDS